MKTFFRKHKIGLRFALAAGIFIAAGFFFLKKEFKSRNPAQFSSTEIKYAEILLDENEKGDDEPSVTPSWEDPLENKEEQPESLDNQLELQLEKEYRARLIKEYKRREEQKKKEEYAKEYLQRAREDGYELTIDKDLNIIEVQKLPEKPEPIYNLNQHVK